MKQLKFPKKEKEKSIYLDRYLTERMMPKAANTKAKPARKAKSIPNWPKLIELKISICLTASVP